MKIYLQPFGGLCNRMRVISSIYEMSKNTNSKLMIRWIINKDLMCSINELFSLPEDIELIEQKVDTTLNRFIVKVFSGYLKLKCKQKYNDEAIIRARMRGTARELLNGDNIFFRTCESLRENFYYNDYSIFIARPDLMDEAKSRIYSISENGKYSVIGIHIRRTDNAIAIESSLSNFYYEIIDRYLDKKKKVRFYIATDSNEEKENFNTKYNRNGEKVVFFAEKIPLDRDSVNGIKAAYIELLTLSLTERIYGSSYSSYSVVAAAINKIQLDLVEKDQMSRLISEIDSIPY